MKPKSKIIYTLLLALPPLLVLSFGSLLYLNTPPEKISINSAASFGDSFGTLNTLFSGLAFSALIVTILLQREELRLQREELRENREELKRSASAQELSARLNAITVLFSEYERIANLKEEEYKRALAAPLAGNISGVSQLREETKKEWDRAHKRKIYVLKELEKTACLRFPEE